MPLAEAHVDADKEALAAAPTPRLLVERLEVFVLEPIGGSQLSTRVVLFDNVGSTGPVLVRLGPDIGQVSL